MDLRHLGAFRAAVQRRPGGRQLVGDPRSVLDLVLELTEEGWKEKEDFVEVVAWGLVGA